MKHVTLMSVEGKLPDIGVINSWLLILLAFTFMGSIAIGNSLLFLILLLWLFEGKFDEKFQRVKHNPFAWAAVVFVLLHFVGLLWTSDWEFAGFVLKKEFKYLMVPVLITVLRKEHITYYLLAFLLSMVVIVGLSYGVYLEWIPPYEIFGLEKVEDPTPFVGHIVYNPVLAFTLYLLLYAVFLRDDLPWKLKAVGLVLFVIMSINMFLTEGRMGQAVFLVLLTLFVFQFYHGRVLKPALLSLLLISILAPTAYLLSPVVQKRVDVAIHEVENYEQEPNSSVGLRVIMLLNSLEIIRENPLLGVGTGDYRQEYIKVNRQNFPEATRGEILNHPHNVYVQEMVQFGLLGLAVLFYMFYVMVRMYKQSSGPFKPVMLAFPVFYAVIFFSDGYIMDHYLTFLFLLLGSILYAGNSLGRD
ncbi:O-antigen ligase family protein [Thiothrix nivea]|uniref:O-antigen polymerase n=1 Tax=Thiothrix nivea (strain ATCC 35100 / DSM 5205 / JP2) TaxID=870187 RepID=A0A656HLT6_THINJ|nr:O-antigen ligase family protein [Thiothrix nivea]EIJ35975.1 O-antigen polymerase [Thiothrix nivea DSM 5205]